MQSVSSRIWTRVAVFISYDDNDYTTGIKVLTEECEYMTAWANKFSMNIIQWWYERKDITSIVNLDMFS